MSGSSPALLHHTFENTVRRTPERTALVCREGCYTYAEIAHDARRLAAFLQHRGVKRGDRVALFLDNSVEAVTAIYAALVVGAIFIPVNPLTKREKLAYVIHDTQPSVLISHAHLSEVFEAVLAAETSIHTCILTGKAHNGFAWREALAHSGDVVEPATIDQDLAAVIYTSGSTGDPKGIMLSHRNMLTAQASVCSYLGLREDDVILCALPLAFDYGLYQILMGFKQGACVVLENSFAFPVKILDLMAAEKVTVFPGVPTMFALMLKLDLSRYDLGKLRMITNTAAALSETSIRDIRRAFPQVRLFSMYGLSECKRVSYLPPEQLDIRPMSVGRGMPNEEIYLVDDGGNRLPNGRTGELVIRGSHVMRGYWGKPEETAKCLKPSPYPGENVLYSGDIFRTDEEGYLYFIGRKDDIIKSRGEKVSPREVENVLAGLDGVLESAVIGVPDPVLGQAVKAFVVLKDGYHYSEKDIARHCLAHLENFMVPKHVVFLPALPKTNTGKISKSRLHQIFMEYTAIDLFINVSDLFADAWSMLSPAVI
jgi:amino acid adenylation domain-containing protein